MAPQSAPQTQRSPPDPLVTHAQITPNVEMRNDFTIDILAIESGRYMIWADGSSHTILCNRSLQTGQNHDPVAPKSRQISLRKRASKEAETDAFENFSQGQSNCACKPPLPPLNPPNDPYRGEVAEWSNAAVSKTVVGLRRPRVRIPVSPP